MSGSSTPRRIAVIGTGYVGLTTGASLAHFGHTVACCDIDADKVAMLQRGTIPIVEDGLAEMVVDNLGAGRLSFHHGSIESAREAEVIFLCVPTPQDDDGSADLRFVREVATELGPHLKPGAIVVNKSTVPVGSFNIVSEALGRSDIDIVSNPEFLREGSAVHDCLHPDRVVIGAENIAAANVVASLYESLDTEFIITDPSSSETIKYAANGFLAMKISFINSVAAMCEQVGADVTAVVQGIGSDRRIGSAFLNPGPGWGGSCFPKDSRALVSIARERGYDFSLMRGVIDINEQQYERMVSKVMRATGRFAHDRLDGIVVGALGLTFKSGTDDLRESPSIRILRDLHRRGATIQAYDPTTSGELDGVQTARLDGLDIRTSMMDAVTGADVVVVLTEWPEFTTLDMAKLAEVMRGASVVDCRNLLEPEVVKSAGLAYDGVGRS